MIQTHANPTRATQLEHDHDEFLHEAIEIADFLTERAITWRGYTNWVGRQTPEKIRPDLPSSGLPHADALSPGLYQGAAGVALFLGHVSKYSGSPSHWEAARGGILEAIRRTRLRFEEGTGPGRDILGFFAGGLGVAYAAFELSDILQEPFLREQGQALYGLLRKVDPKTCVTDMMGGMAGAIPTLLSLHNDHAVADARDAAIKLGDFLLSIAYKTDSGALVWERPRDAKSERPLTGLTHGAAGYAYGFLRLFQETGNERYREAAFAALQYERELFNEREGNWPDLRFGDVDPPYQAIWCHGAGGIGVSRAAMISIVDDTQMREELSYARKATGTYTREKLELPGVNWQLCHGIAGNIECLWIMESALDIPTALDRARAGAFLGIRQFGHVAKEKWGSSFVDWPTGHPGHHELSLYFGLAGIGYFLLRVAAPEEVPTVLLPGVSWKSPTAAFERVRRRD